MKAQGMKGVAQAAVDKKKPTKRNKTMAPGELANQLKGMNEN